ncbi:hypothetical protein T440DRAFT_509553 [Plenodomus tracheiphilus IPT5]|uniref:FHA domain-containing protein n=1 Tax=Plenodomus tracheiphilus IPT5 TaxID=1408161 RepID=A0A6A7AZG5_9PLEO|nr:hypothetical protein T440DRAFT_509553 [Plenodomus tracheiphilus IPT5]
MSDTFRIVLRDVQRHDAFEKREFVLPIDRSIYPIGRASKSEAKRNLLPAPHNAYIDSPVVSREHAILTASPNSGNPVVFISDCGSMHGTMVNGRKLAPHDPEILVSGDLLQFGVDINRNEEFFVARKYTFESQLIRPYSLGFAVPDAESEEEHVETHEQHGSQLNPLVLDDSDAGSVVDGAAVDEEDSNEQDAAEEEEEDDDDDEDVTMMETEQLKPWDLDLSFPADSIKDLFAQHSKSDVRTTVGAEAYSDGEESVHQYSSGNEDSDEVDVLADHETESVASSKADESSEQEIADSDDEDVSSPVVLTGSVFAPTTLPSGLPLAEPGVAHMNMNKSRNAFTLDDDLETPLARSIFGQKSDSTSFGESAAPFLPSQPAEHYAELPNPYTESYRVEDHDWSVLRETQVHTANTNSADRSSYASPLFGHSMGYFQASSLVDDRAESARQALSLQTPPPMPASDVVASAQQPVRRTKVSIDEIVEDQPPTPESVNNMKRKADVLEEEHRPAVRDPDVVLPESTSITDDLVVAVQADQPAALIAQRPKKQPRSVLAKFGLTAKYLGLGTAGAVAAITALSTLPDTFFT